jgi:hypothetical protein
MRTADSVKASQKAKRKSQKAKVVEKVEKVKIDRLSLIDKGLKPKIRRKC